MTADDFIEAKAPQLAFYGKAFLDEQLEYKEIQLYMWDVLEEWQCLVNTPQSKAQLPSETEQVFWHLLHCFDKWPEWAIRGNQYLRKQVDDCCDFLNIGGKFPDSCIGIRP
ncbi:hypothetical protein G3R49_03360 [Shewanella sp. WXL01]|uniref:Uncharacterized protein n=1 Tax=Shewanella maritima TaxID=2520507 RepID=A0A411PMS0_9GAMM|nr:MULTISPECIES: hypothetical protein [Shewanella]NKF49613.1 hypothetical protein [Shewanella sp. WXL01]QBF84809.1 hypothetical protein EXU30_05940 [Shewanella maritima]